MAVKFDVAKCPVCGGPLEAAYEYGHTILKCPYCGFYTYVTITGGKFVSEVPIVTPKWTVHARQALKIATNEIAQSYNYLKKGNIDEAYRRLMWVRNTLYNIPEEAQDLPLIDKIQKSIGEAQNFHWLYKQEGDEYYKEQFANEVKDLYNSVVKTSPLVGGKRKRKR
jgi:rRNA maturation protein Nop10